MDIFFLIGLAVIAGVGLSAGFRLENYAHRCWTKIGKYIGQKLADRNFNRSK